MQPLNADCLLHASAFVIILFGSTSALYLYTILMQKTKSYEKQFSFLFCSALAMVVLFVMSNRVLTCIIASTLLLRAAIALALVL